MSRLSKRPQVNHRTTAQALRQRPGVWLVVGDYRTSSSAKGICYAIQSGSAGSGAWYQPAGSFETRTSLVEDGIRVYACYVGGAR